MTTHQTYKDQDRTIEVRTNPGASPRVFINGHECPRDSQEYKDIVEKYIHKV